jgi:hypothetical protein
MGLMGWLRKQLGAPKPNKGGGGCGRSKHLENIETVINGYTVNAFTWVRYSTESCEDGSPTQTGYSVDAQVYVSPAPAFWEYGSRDYYSDKAHAFGRGKGYITGEYPDFDALKIECAGWAQELIDRITPALIPFMEP